MELDLEHLALFVGLALSRETLERLQAEGFPEARFAHGFVFQHLVAGRPTVSELATELGVSQQAASKRVRELVQVGFVRQVPDPRDRRASRLELSERGWALVERARAIRAERVQALVEEVGEARYRVAAEVLRELLDARDPEARVQARRVRWPD